MGFLQFLSGAFLFLFTLIGMMMSIIIIPIVFIILLDYYLRLNIPLNELTWAMGILVLYGSWIIWRNLTNYR